MSHIIRLVFTIVFFFLTWSASAQFWFGPKVGLNFTNNVYDDTSYKARYNVTPALDWQAGLSMDYDSEGRFVVHTELTYERVSNSVKNIDGEARLEASSVYHFLSLPMIARVVIAGKRSPIKIYAQAGPRMKFWLAGKGLTVSGLTGENGFDGYGYRVAFKDVEDRNDDNLSFPDGPNSNGDIIVSGWEFVVEKPNRVQYSIDFGAGMFIDLANGHRVNVDAKISWGHSNMGFNVPGDGLNIADYTGFDEDLEYHHNMVTLSAAYLIGYDPAMSRKGKTTDGTKKKKYK